MATCDLELGERDVIQETARNLLDRVRNQGNHMNRFSPTVYMAPSVLRDLSPNSFNPRMVSIGPLHKEDENVQAFEKQKETYLLSLMNRIRSPQEEILTSCLEKAYASMSKIKACYVWTKEYDEVEIAEMMVMDACFILEFMLQAHFSFNDNSFMGKKLHIQTLMHDLMLLENQIPFFFLHEIYECTILKCYPRSTSLIKFIHPLIGNHGLFEGYMGIDNISINSTHHILSLLHEYYKPQSEKSEFLTFTIPSTLDLDRAGVNFKPKTDPTWAMEMEVESYGIPCLFESWNKPTLTMPVLRIVDSTEMVLRNLIAYEQSFQTSMHITSYAFAIDMLVNTHEDVAKLIDSRVLVNYMGSNEEAANMINSLTKHVTIFDDFFYVDQWMKLNKYCDGYWPKHISKMKRTYFSSPWSMIALLAGIILFILTVVQTIFTVKSA